MLNSSKQNKVYALWSRLWDMDNRLKRNRVSKAMQLHITIGVILNRDIYTSIAYLNDKDCERVITALQDRINKLEDKK